MLDPAACEQWQLVPQKHLSCSCHPSVQYQPPVHKVIRVMLVGLEVFTPLPSLKRENFTGKIDFQTARFLLQVGKAVRSFSVGADMRRCQGMHTRWCPETCILRHMVILSRLISTFLALAYWTHGEG